MIERERRGDYLGKTVQVVPHITDAISDWIERVAKVPGTYLKRHLQFISHINHVQWMARRASQTSA